MIRLMWRLVRARVTVLVLGGALYLGGPYLLTHAGRYLITQDPLVKADMALVLSGQPYLCVPEAARLYHEGLVPKILLVNEPRPPARMISSAWAFAIRTVWRSPCSSWRRCGSPARRF